MSGKFYRTVVQVEILSDELVPDPADLDGINYQITEGGWSGLAETIVLNEEVSRERMAVLLIAQGSDPSFLLGDVTPCDECGNEIPDGEPSEVNRFHAESCSLYPDEEEL